MLPFHWTWKTKNVIQENPSFWNPIPSGFRVQKLVIQLQGFQMQKGQSTVCAFNDLDRQNLEENPTKKSIATLPDFGAIPEPFISTLYVSAQKAQKAIWIAAFPQVRVWKKSGLQLAEKGIWKGMTKVYLCIGGMS